MMSGRLQEEHDHPVYPSEVLEVLQAPPGLTRKGAALHQQAARNMGTICTGNPLVLGLCHQPQAYNEDHLLRTMEGAAITGGPSAHSPHVHLHKEFPAHSPHVH